MAKLCMAKLSVGKLRVGKLCGKLECIHYHNITLSGCSSEAQRIFICQKRIIKLIIGAHRNKLIGPYLKQTKY